MTKLSFKAILAALVTTGLLFAGFVGVGTPALAVSPATTLTVTPNGTLVLSDTTTPAFTVETNGSPDIYTQANTLLFVIMDGSGGAFRPLDSCTMGIPTWANCKISGVTRNGTALVESDADVDIEYTGGRHYLKFVFSSLLAGDSVGISFANGAFNAGTQWSGSTNFTAEMSFYNASMSGSGSLSAGSVSFVRSVPPAVSPATLSMTGWTASPPSSSPALSTEGILGTVTYSTSLSITGYDFDTSTGRYNRNSTPVAAVGSTTATITATGSTSGSATATLTVYIQQSLASITYSGSSSYTLSGPVNSPLSGPTPNASGFVGAVTYAASSVPTGLSFNTSTGQFTGTPTQTSSAIVTVTATGATSGSATAIITFNIYSGGGGGSMPTAVQFTATGSLTDANSTSITSFPASSSVPAFTATATNISGGATYRTIGVIFSTTSGSTQYFSVANASNMMTQGSPPPSPSAWSPGSCGITAISLAGVTQTGSSGITCQKQTWTFNSANAYAVRIYLPSETSSAVSISVADGVFTSGTAGNYNFRLSLSSAPVNNSYFSGTASVPITVGGSGVSTPAPTPSNVQLTLGVSSGQLIAGAPVAINASGLQVNAQYTIVVQSTPQTLASGTAANGVVSSNVTIPSGLEAGWHTLTFTSTAADGSEVVSKLYFKVAGDGTLLSATTTTPVELAFTGSSDFTSVWGEIALALMGFGILLYVRQRKRNA